MEILTINNVWMMICTALVFFMHLGFSFLEIGLTRQKNTINILFKNIFIITVGLLLYCLIGFNLMYPGEFNGFIGFAGFGLDSPLTAEGTLDLAYNEGYTYWTDFLFQGMFAATAATIVSGAIAERTKFSTYLVFSLLMTMIIYPISGHWVWQSGGWLAKLGFIDFAGSTVVHSVGGWASLVAAFLVGPRLGKYTNGKSNAIPGHNLLIGSLGIFILWLGWFGFNAGSQLAISGDNANAVAGIIITTNLAGAAGALSAMFITWIIYGKPDISMTLNGVLAGLVAITAGCAAVSPMGAFIIGSIAGIVVVFSIDFIDKKLKIDDPVGAISVHGVTGALGTLLVGVFATDGGLLYGGGFHQLGVQAIGVFSIAAWAIGASFVVLFILKKTMGLRVSKEEEEDGLDIHEHDMNVYN